MLSAWIDWTVFFPFYSFKKKILIWMVLWWIVTTSWHHSCVLLLKSIHCIRNRIHFFQMKSWWYECFAETLKGISLPKWCRNSNPCTSGFPIYLASLTSYGYAFLSLTHPCTPTPTPKSPSYLSTTCSFPFSPRRFLFSEKQKSYPFFFSHSAQMSPLS